MAEMAENDHLVELLLNSKDIDQLYGDSLDSLLHLAIHEDDEEMVKVLIRSGANLNIANADDYTPLGLALSLDNSRGTAIAKMLVRAGAFPNMKSVMSLMDSIGETPLHIASETNNFPEACELLLTRGARLNARDHFLSTPLHTSISSRQDSNTEILMQHGADLNAVDKMNAPPLYWCRNDTMIKYLLITGAPLTRAMLEHFPYKWLLMWESTQAAWLQNHISQPRSLRALCCFAIRQHLNNVSDGKTIMWRIQALPIPNPLKDLLIFRGLHASLCQGDQRFPH
ncbi:hypothetical protein C0Q70_06378 [Pomacea canaliculata]|uniref:SOCS box domain-containing protein n=1 Tax=Pomacea canaliculata TaxID=400727 RepID=A0A2T7PNZ5_POMCA|nr:hypothetical protein C0Q70_06378 [Pomacea canaliculata]